MALTDTTCAVVYAGNESTSTAYAIPFRFVAPADIFVTTQTGADDPVLLAPGDYTVTQIGDGTGSLTTASAIGDDVEVTIFRQTPPTQPAVYETGGPFPAKAHEAALDRLAMLVQEMARKSNQALALLAVPGTTAPDGSTVVVPGSVPDSLRDVVAFADTADRLATTPAAKGRLGIQLDDLTIWVSQSTTAGDWVLAVDPSPDARARRVTLAVAADTGLQTQEQTDLANFITGWDTAADAVILAGDVSYNGESNFGADVAVWDPFIAAEKALMVPGNHDIDGPTQWANLVHKTPYLDWTNRNWRKTLGNGLVEIFGLHSGRNSAWTLAETDGNAVGSAQHTRFVQWLAASAARWKIVVFHHPPTSSETEAVAGYTGHEPHLDWPEFAQVDALICGHSHLTEVINFRGTPIVNCSGWVKQDGDTTLMLAGQPENSSLIYANDRRRLVGRITATEDRLSLELLDPSGAVFLTRSLDDLSMDNSQWGLEVVPPDTTAAVGTYHAGQAPVGMTLHQCFIGVASPGSPDLTGTVSINGVPSHEFTLPSGDFWTLSEPIGDKGRILPLGALVEVTIGAIGSYPAHRGLSIYARGRIVQ